MKRLALLALLAAGCQPRTEMMIGIATDIRAPDVLDSVQLNVTRTVDGMPEEQLPPWTITGIPDQPFNLPGSYGVYSDGTEIKIEIDLTGLKNDNPVVLRRAIMSLVGGKTLFVRMGLTVGCMNRNDCTNNQSCVEGVCKDIEIDSSQLPDFEDSLVTELTCNSGTNFINTADGTPMPLSADAMNCPGSLCSEGTCLKPPMMDGGSVGLRDGSTNQSCDPTSDSPNGGCPSGAQCVNGMCVFATQDGGSGAPDFGTTSPLAGCPGDSIGMSTLFQSTTGVSGLVIDPMSGTVIWAEDMATRIMMSTPCSPNPLQVTTTSGSPLALAVTQQPGDPSNSIFYVDGGSLFKVAIAPNSTATSLTSLGSTSFVFVQGTQGFYVTGSVIDMVTFSNPTPSLLFNNVSSPNGLVAEAGGAVFWFDNMAADAGALGLVRANPGGMPQLVTAISGSNGLATDGKNVYFTDSGLGVMMVSAGGGVPQQITTSALLQGTDGRVIADGNFVYFASTTGEGDTVFQARPQPSATSTVLASGGGVTVNNQSVFPLMAVGANGIYWVDVTGSIHRAPSFTAAGAPQ